MVEEGERRDRSPDRGDVSGNERWVRDSEAREIEHQLTPEEQAARQTYMRRRVEAGESEDAAWENAVRDVREHRVRVALEGDEGARRDVHPVQARKQSSWPDPETVPDEEERRIERE